MTLAAVFPPYSPPCDSPHHSSSTDPLFFCSLSELKQVSQGYQPNMEYQVTVTVQTYPPIKDGEDSPRGGKGSREQAKESETAPIPTVRSPTRTPNYTAITFMQRT